MCPGVTWTMLSAILKLDLICFMFYPKERDRNHLHEQSGSGHGLQTKKEGKYHVKGKRHPVSERTGNE